MLLVRNVIAFASFMKWSVCLDFFGQDAIVRQDLMAKSNTVDFSGQYNHIMAVFISRHLDGSDYTVHICLVPGDLRPR
jgi:hypothetical protein